MNFYLPLVCLNASGMRLYILVLPILANSLYSVFLLLFPELLDLYVADEKYYKT